MQYDHGLQAMTSEELKKVQEEKGRARRRREAARERAEALEARLEKAETLRPGGWARVVATVFAILTHALALLVLAVSVVFFSLGNIVGWVFGLLCVGIVWVVRPRIPRAPKGEEWKTRADLPRFFTMLDKVAATIDAPVPTHLTFATAFNASTARRGLRHRPTLTIGVPLWISLSRSERLALLGHELGHQVNGDSTSGILVSSANQSLSMWRYLFNPRATTLRVYGARYSLIQAIAVPVFLFPIYISMTLLQRLYRWIGIHVSLHAEYLADDYAARVGSSEGALGLIRKLGISSSVQSYFRRTKAARGPRAKVTNQDAADAWDGLVAYLASMPEHEHIRQARVSEFRGTAADSSHPANYLRTRFLEARPHREAALTITEEEWAAVDRELAEYMASGVGRLIR